MSRKLRRRKDYTGAKTVPTEMSKKGEGRGFPRPSMKRSALDYGQAPLTMSAPGPALFQTLPPTVLSTQ
jgi:hypothetical protein